MASIDWPSAANLPQHLRLEGYAQTRQDDTIRSPMGYGPDKVRRRTTGVVQRVPGTLVLTDTEKNNLITFYETTLEGGVNLFNWTDFLAATSPATSVEYRFVTAPVYTTMGGDLWLASLMLEIMP